MMCLATPMNSQGVVLWPLQHRVQRFKTGVSGMGYCGLGSVWGGYGLVFAGDGVSLFMERSSPRPASNLGVWTLFLTLNCATALLPRGHMCMETYLPATTSCRKPRKNPWQVWSTLVLEGASEPSVCKGMSSKWACRSWGSVGPGSGHALSRQGNRGRPSHRRSLSSSQCLPIFVRLVIAASWYFRATRQGLPQSLNTRVWSPQGGRRELTWKVVLLSLYCSTVCACPSPNKQMQQR